LDTGITREGTFAAGFVLAASAGLRGLSGAESMSVTLGLLCLMYAAIALTTASGGVRVTSTTVSCAAWLGVAASLTATADGGEILAAYLLLIAVIVLIAIAAVLDTFGERSISPVSVAMEGMAGVGGFFAFMLALQSALDSALLITTFCALLAAMSLRESRRPAVWWALGLSVIAVALWLRAAHVETVEGYTIPIAMVLLIVGVIAYQRRPSQTSWVTFWPALLIGVTPSLGLVLFAKADPLRALLLGTAALGIMTIGTFTGRQAPFVLGAVAVAVVAVRMVTPLLPRLSADLPVWVPLAGAGVLLVIVGASYERGRRDMRRLVGVIRRMD
ncbi:MAG: SCO7613 C-terminal domain-containing membrane protein, partial [Mycobacteriales bacterium]